MDKNNLPLHVDPFRLAENAERLHGYVQIKDMERLTPSLLKDVGEVAVELIFGKDAQDISYLQGKFETNVVLQCQRCLEPFSLNIKNHFNSGIVRTEAQAKKLPDQYEPLIVKEDELIIRDMIEDELILSLPIVPMHDHVDCKIQLPISAADVETEATGNKANPFKVIESLKSKNKE